MKLPTYLTDIAGRGSWRVDYDSRNVSWSPGMFLLYNKDPVTFVPTVQFMCHAYPPLREAMFLWLLSPDIATEQHLSYECVHSLPGEQRHRLLVNASAHVRDGALEYVYGTSTDLDTLQLPSNDAQEQYDQYKMLFKYAPNGLLQAGTDKRIILVNPAFCSLLGYSSDELLSMTTEDITHTDDRDMSTDAVRRLFSGEIEHLSYDKRYVHKDGRSVWIHLSVSLFRGANGQPHSFIGQCQDVSERRALETSVAVQLQKEQEQGNQLRQHNSQLVRMASTDSLTSLKNRAAFDAALALAHAKEIGSCVIISVEIGALTLRNRTYGQAVVDELLRNSARAIVVACPSATCIARLSGGTFRIILEDLSAPAADSVISAIEQNLAALRCGRSIIKPIISLEWIRPSQPCEQPLLVDGAIARLTAGDAHKEAYSYVT